MIAHLGIYVANLKDSGAFYTPLLASIGWSIVLQNDFFIAYGKNNTPYFEIYTGRSPASPIHIAFDCLSHEEVNTFYNKAIGLKATDNGKPGFRDYFPNYYACYVIDINNHNLEALCFKK